MTVDQLERAAIQEYAGNLPRQEAERQAALEERPPPARCVCRACVAAGRATVLG